MKNPPYSPQFREQALAKVLARKNSTIDQVALELNINSGTLKSWLRSASRTNKVTQQQVSKKASDWSLAERLLALQQTHALEPTELATWCRERGLFVHQLTQWSNDFCTSPSSVSQHESQQEMRALKLKNQQLQSNLSRKEKALAEAAALLILQKKFQALLEDEES